MRKYTEEEKANALAMLESEGPAKTRDTLGIPLTTIYRWKQARDEEMNPSGEQTDEWVFPDEEAPESSGEEPTPASPEDKQMNHAAVIKKALIPADDSKDDSSFIIDLLMEKNRKLSQENKQLRMVLKALLD